VRKIHLVERVFQLEFPFKKTGRLFSIVWATEEKAALIFSFLFDFPHASIQSLSALHFGFSNSIVSVTPLPEITWVLAVATNKKRPSKVQFTNVFDDLHSC
jgi:hypothetical protein